MKQKKTISHYASGKYVEFVNRHSELSGGLIGVEGDNFLLADGTSLYLEPKSLIERWDEEAEAILEHGGYKKLFK